MFTRAKPGWGARRRAFLTRCLGAGVAALLPLKLDGQLFTNFHPGQKMHASGGSVPPTQVSLADYGGKPGAAPPVLIAAFQKALAALSDAGGGTLLVPAGTYDFGNYDEAATIILCRDLHDIVISAYGALFTATTTATVMPSLFYFFNFNNVTIAGASFFDSGFNPQINWQGLYCVGIQADKPSSGFFMVDCYAAHVLGVLDSNNNAASGDYMSNIHVQGEVRHAYYGVGASHVREKVYVDLDCYNVRRAFIAYAVKNAEITVRTSNTSSWPGSNGLIALVCAGAHDGNVENVRVKVDVSGECIHSSYVHFYQQGPEKQGAMHDIDATVNAIDVRDLRCLFMFDHESNGIRPSTSRSWDRIWLHGSVTGTAGGSVILNPSVSTSPGIVYVDRNLTHLPGMDALPGSLRIRSI